MSLVGDSQALERAITRANGGVKPHGKVPVQAHHLLSSNVVVGLDAKYEFLPANKALPQKLADAAGYLLNEAPNGLLLPYHFGHQMKLHLQRHCGDHFDEYYDNVRSVLEPTYQHYKTKDVCPGTPANTSFLQALKNAETTVKGNLSGDPPTWWLYEWSQPLWDNDYRDEGTGNLYLNRPPDISYKAGLAWVDDKVSKGEIKRRYKKKRGSKNAYEVKKGWYRSHTYPPPSALY